jgi:hypothetical protein
VGVVISFVPLFSTPQYTILRTGTPPPPRLWRVFGDDDTHTWCVVQRTRRVRGAGLVDDPPAAAHHVPARRLAGVGGGPVGAARRPDLHCGRRHVRQADPRAMESRQIRHQLRTSLPPFSPLLSHAISHSLCFLCANECA